MKYLLFCLLFFVGQSYAKDSDPNLRLHQVINKYRNSPAVEMKLNKTVEMSLLGETKKSKGKLYLSNNKMRYEIQKPEKHLVVMNDKGIWIENKLSEKLGGKVQVTHLRSKSGQKKVKGFLAAFFGNSNVKDDLNFKETSKNTFKVIFKKKSEMADVKSARIGIDKSAEEITFIEYTDSLENKTRHDFSKVSFKSKAISSKFKYVPPKGAESTEM